MNNTIHGYEGMLENAYAVGTASRPAPLLKCEQYHPSEEKECLKR